MKSLPPAKEGNSFSAALLIAGTAIGVSYFSIPVLTGLAGFLPAVFMTVLVWGFTLAIGLLYAEVTLGQPDGANLISFSRVLLGKTWTVIITAFFCINIFIYLATYAFFVEKFITWFLLHTFQIKLSAISIGLLSVAPFFLIIFLGLRVTFRVNDILMLCLGISLFLTIYQGSTLVIHSRLLERQWIYIFFAVPVLFSALGYTGIMPPVCTFLNRDPKKIKAAVWIGTLIPLVVYLFWQWFLIGSISSGTFLILNEQGITLDAVFALLQTYPHMAYLLNFTLFFSMITSLVGHGLGLVEFLSDGFRIPLEKRKGGIRLLLCTSVFIVVLVLSFAHEKPAFYHIRNFASPIGEVLINGIIPLLLIIQARYFYHFRAPVILPGGRLVIGVLSLAIFILIYLEGVVFIRHRV